jgi:endonuclease III
MHGTGRFGVRGGQGHDAARRRPGMTAREESIVRELLTRHGRLYAEDAGIRLADRPGPLYQLLVLATLLSAPIPAETAVAGARELFAAGYRSPKAMSEASWQDRVEALGRGRYRRYDERTATMLGDGADLLASKWHGDLRRLRDEAAGEVAGIASRLTEFPGVGPVGASIFLREAQEVWPDVAPYADVKVTSGARRVRLPADRETLAGLIAASGQPARLAAALVRVSLSQRAASEVTASVRD